MKRACRGWKPAGRCIRCRRRLIFRGGNRLISWFVGGLNYQIEHHLFPKICHVNYPVLSKVVEEECREFGLRYAVHRSLFSAIAAHYRWLVAMGRQVLGLRRPVDAEGVRFAGRGHAG